MIRIAPLLVAALGGITPNLLTLAVQLTAKNSELPSPTYVIGLLIFASLGAAIAYIWEEGNLKKAFYLGVGLPSLIQLNVANFGTASQPPTASRASSFSEIQFALIPAAEAQEEKTKVDGNDTESGALNRRLVIIPGEISSAPYYSVVFFSEKAGGLGIERFMVTEFDPLKTTELPVPDFAQCAMIQVGSESYGGRVCWPFERDVVRTVRIDVKAQFWSGLLRSLGVIDANKYRIEVTLEKTN